MSNEVEQVGENSASEGAEAWRSDPFDPFGDSATSSQQPLSTPLESSVPTDIDRTNNSVNNYNMNNDLLTSAIVEGGRTNDTDLMMEGGTVEDVAVNNFSRNFSGNRAEEGPYNDIMIETSTMLPPQSEQPFETVETAETAEIAEIAEIAVSKTSVSNAMWGAPTLPEMSSQEEKALPPVCPLEDKATVPLVEEDNEVNNSPLDTSYKSTDPDMVMMESVDHSLSRSQPTTETTETTTIHTATDTNIRLMGEDGLSAADLYTTPSVANRQVESNHSKRKRDNYDQTFSAAQSYVEDRITALRESVHASLRAAQQQNHATETKFEQSGNEWRTDATHASNAFAEFSSSMEPSTGLAIVHSLVQTLMKDGVNISAFITENIGDTEVNMAPASWRDLDAIFNNHDDAPKQLQNVTSLNLKLACEKLQLALMQLSSTETKHGTAGGGEGGEDRKMEIGKEDVDAYIQLAESAAHDFCSGVRAEIEHLVDTIMEREPFVKQLEQMLAKELEKTRDYDDVSNRYEKELAEMRGQLQRLKEKEEKNRKLLGTVTGDMRAQLELSRRLLGPRAFLFQSSK